MSRYAHTMNVEEKMAKSAMTERFCIFRLTLLSAFFGFAMSCSLPTYLFIITPADLADTKARVIRAMTAGVSDGANSMPM